MLHPVVLSGGILLEPAPRNTAPAIALAALHAIAHDPDATLLVMPADHLIEDEAAFRAAVAKALVLADDGWLVAFGIEPDYPEIGYGYIRRGEPLGAAGSSRMPPLSTSIACNCSPTMNRWSSLHTVIGACASGSAAALSTVSW